MTYEGLEIITQYIFSENNELEIIFNAFNNKTDKPENIGLITIYKDSKPTGSPLIILKPRTKISSFNTNENLKNFDIITGDRNLSHLKLNKDDNYYFILDDTNGERPSWAVWKHDPYYTSINGRWLFDDKGNYMNLFGVTYKAGFLWNKDKISIYMYSGIESLFHNNIRLINSTDQTIECEIEVHDNNILLVLDKRLIKDDFYWIIFPNNSFNIEDHKQLKYLYIP